jgi:hypothetical protein
LQIGFADDATGDRSMIAKKAFLALVLLLTATSMTLAQSQRNYGPNGPSRSNCFGGPYSGAVASRCPRGHR